MIFKEGDQPDSVYMIESGLVDMVVRRPDGAETLLGTLGKGDMFGEMALIDGKPRMATARVSMQCTVVVIPTEAFKAQLKTVNPVMTRVMMNLVKRLRTMGHELALARVDRP